VLPWWIVVAALAVGIAIVVLRAEPFVPTVTLEAPLDTIGRATALRVAAHDRGSGLARIEVRLVPEEAATPRSWRARSTPRCTGDGRAAA